MAYKREGGITIHVLFWTALATAVGAAACGLYQAIAPQRFAAAGVCLLGAWASILVADYAVEQINEAHREVCEDCRHQ